MSKRNLAVLVVSLVLMAAVGAACAKAAPTPTPTATPRPVATPTATPTPAPTPTPTAVQPKRGGIMRQIAMDEWPHFDSHQSVANEVEVTQSTHDFLVRLGTSEAADRVEPDLAKNWTLSADGTRITFSLQTGVQWHDGKPFSCTDVQYTFHRIINPPTGMSSLRKGTFAALERVECPDPATAVFVLKYPWADAIINIADPYNIIVAKHIAEPRDAAGDFLKKPDSVVGTGPFKLVSFKTTESAIVTKNASYWRPGLPYLDGVETYFVTERRTRISSLQAGRVDYIVGVDVEALLKELDDTSQGRWTVRRQPKRLVVLFIPDMKEGSRWQDIELRKAAALAICRPDFRAALGDIMMVRWEPSMLAPGDPWNLPKTELQGIPGYGEDCAANLAKAKEIVERKGEKGKKLTIQTTTAWNFTEFAIVYAEMLSKAGWVVDSQGMEIGPYYDMINNKRIPPGNAVAHSVAIYGGGIDGTLGHAFHPTGARNYGAYEDQKLRQMYDAQSRELDPAKRKVLVLEYERYFLSQYYAVIAGWRGQGAAWWNYVKGYYPTVNSSWPEGRRDVWLDK